jgi:hypothetical protein
LPTSEHEDGGFKGLGITYAIWPGSAWGMLKSDCNFIDKHVHTVLLLTIPNMVADRLLTYIVGEQIFSLGSIVYINRYSPASPAPPFGSSEEIIRGYDQANLWWPKFLMELRRIAYMPAYNCFGGTGQMSYQVPYHDANELIMSNAMDIVDAMTVVGPAKVTHWDEQKTIRGSGTDFSGSSSTFKTFRGSKGSELPAIR